MEINFLLIQHNFQESFIFLFRKEEYRSSLTISFVYKSRKYIHNLSTDSCPRFPEVRK